MWQVNQPGGAGQIMSIMTSSSLCQGPYRRCHFFTPRSQRRMPYPRQQACSIIGRWIHQNCSRRGFDCNRMIVEKRPRCRFLPQTPENPSLRDRLGFNLSLLRWVWWTPIVSYPQNKLEYPYYRNSLNHLVN